MDNDDFEAYTFTGYDLNNAEYTEDNPHEIMAHIGGNIEVWRAKCIGSWFIQYYRAKAERYTEEAWRKFLIHSDTGSAMDEITREVFDHYTSGVMFG